MTAVSLAVIVALSLPFLVVLAIRPQGLFPKVQG